MISFIKVLIPLIVTASYTILFNSNRDDFELIKERVVGELMKSDIDDRHVETILGRLKKNGSFQDINYEDLSRTAGFPQRAHNSDLTYLAKAYKNKDSKFYQDEKLKKEIIQSLQYWVNHDFFGDNWHNNQISTPTHLVDLMLVMGEELPKDLVQKAQPIIGRAHMNASGARPSGDRIVIAGILAKNLLFMGDRAGFDQVIKIIEGEIKFNTGSRGMQHDYSFHHREDRVNNTTSYGYGKYANAFGEWSYYVAGTTYAFSEEKIKQLVDYYLDGIYKQLVYGIYTDVSVVNRSITQKANFEPQGVLEIQRLMISTDYRKKELQEIIDLRLGKARPSKSFSKFFWQTEHFVFQRPGFYTTVRMYSSRNRNMEEPYNGPGKTTHHRADGTNYLMLNGDEYHNIWPVYDWQKISGTTILQKPRLPGPDSIQMDGVTDFVGAVTDGLYGAVAFDFISPHDRLEAKKSWFFFDEEYVCLGTDIKSAPDLPVVTTINQVLMRGDVTIMEEGEVKTLVSGSHNLKEIKFLHHDNIGYIFPTPKTVEVSNQLEEGRWSDITDQKNISTETVAMNVFKLWVNHGNSPDTANYQYIVVPGVNKQELIETSQNNRQIEILASNSEIHAVRHKKLDISQIIFYKAGTVRLADGLKLKMDSPGMAMLKIKDDRVFELTVSDPLRKSSRLLVTLSGEYNAKGAHFAILPNADQKDSMILINLPQDEYAGNSVTVSLESK